MHSTPAWALPRARSTPRPRVPCSYPAPGWAAPPSRRSTEGTGDGMKNERLATGRGGDQALDPDGQDVDSGNVLEVTGLTVATPGRRGAKSGPPLVNDVSFSIGAGEVVAIVGESGSG